MLAVLCTWPLLPQAADHVFGQGTPPLNVWAMAWVRHQLPRAPLQLFDANAFHPYADSLAFSEHLFVPALLGAPVALLTGNHVLAHNLVALLSFALAGLGMYLLARELLGGDGPGPFAAGLFYAFHTWNQNELIRLQILSNQWFPFLLLALLRYFQGPSWRRAAAAAGFYLLQSLSCMYWALYAPLLLLAALPALQWRLRLSLRRLVPLATALLAAAVLLAPFFVPYWRTSRQLEFAREAPEALDLSRYLDVRAGSPYEAWLGTANLNQNAAHFLGFVPLLLLGLVALRRGERLRPLDRGFFWALAAAALALSLGHELRLDGRYLGPAPYQLLYDFVPGFRNVRYPERFALFLALALAPLVGLGVQLVARRFGRRAGLLVALLIYVEHLALPTALVPLPGPDGIPSAYRWLGTQAGVRVVADLPSSRYWMERVDGLPMYYSTAHWKRTLQGFTGYFPPAYAYMKWRLARFPEPASLDFLRQAGVDTLVLGPGWAGQLPPDLPYRRVGPFPEGHLVLHDDRPLPREVAPPAPDAEPLPELPTAGWQVQASRPGAEKAIDRNGSTAWTTGEFPQVKGDYFRVAFPRPVRLARLSLSVRAPYEFPMVPRLVGRYRGETRPLPVDVEAAQARLFAWLVQAPRQARLDLDLVPPALVDSVRVSIADDDPYAMPWTLHELQAFGRVAE